MFIYLYINKYYLIYLYFKYFYLKNNKIFVNTNIQKNLKNFFQNPEKINQNIYKGF